MKDNIVKDGEEGFMFKIGNWRKEEKKIERIEEDKRMRVEMGEEGVRKVIEELEREIVGREYEGLIKNMSENRKKIKKNMDI